MDGPLLATCTKGKRFSIARNTDGIMCWYGKCDEPNQPSLDKPMSIVPVLICLFAEVLLTAVATNSGKVVS